MRSLPVVHFCCCRMVACHEEILKLCTPVCKMRRHGLCFVHEPRGASMMPRKAEPRHFLRQLAKRKAGEGLRYGSFRTLGEYAISTSIGLKWNSSLLSAKMAYLCSFKPLTSEGFPIQSLAKIVVHWHCIKDGMDLQKQSHCSQTQEG